MENHNFTASLKQICKGWLKTDVDLRPYSYLRTGGVASRFVLVSDEVTATEEGEDDLPDKIMRRLQTVIRFLHQEGKTYRVLGKGSNVIIKDGVVETVVIHLDFKKIPQWQKKRVLLETNKMGLTLPASLPLIRALKVAHDLHLRGLEFVMGIPGTVGGAVVMNAGVKGREIKDVLHQADILRPQGITQENSQSLEHSYRHSNLSEEDVVLQAEFALDRVDEEEIARLRKTSLEELEHRKKTQPLKYPSVGSTFKNPLPEYAGALIEGCGLKDYSCGGIKISSLHANFIVNEGDGTSEEALRLIDIIRETVYSRTGIRLETEVKEFGFEPLDRL